MPASHPKEPPHHWKDIIFERHPTGCRFRSLGQAMQDRIPREVGGGLELQFLQNTRPVGADGLHAQGELVGNSADGLALGNQAQHLELAIGEFMVRRPIHRLEVTSLQDRPPSI